MCYSILRNIAIFFFLQIKTQDENFARMLRPYEIDIQELTLVNEYQFTELQLKDIKKRKQFCRCFLSLSSAFVNPK